MVTGGASMYEPVEYRTEAGREPAPSGDHERSGDRAQIGLALHQAVLADFVHAIAAHAPPRVSLREAARSLAFVEALYESAAARRRVTVSAGDSGGGRNDRTNG